VTGLNVLLVPLGKVPQAALETLARDTQAALGMPVGVAAPLPLPATAYRAERKQHISSLLLEALRRIHRGQRLLGVTEADIFAPGLNFVFGEAELPGRVAVISTCRLHEEFWGRPANPDLFRRRALTEAVHELGHTLGLAHCQDPGCVMRFSNTLADTDRKGPDFCPGCRAKNLPQL
jgi:archaemetzincin